MWGIFHSFQKFFSDAMSAQLKQQLRHSQSSIFSSANNRIRLLHGQSADQCVIDREDSQKYEPIC